jgi:hypothetical protein
MELQDQKKLAQHIFRLLKVTEITFTIGRTNKGNLSIKFSANNDDYEMMLDAVPLTTKSLTEDENNIELKRMLEKYWFDTSTPTQHIMTKFTRFEANELPATVEKIEAKKKGRPKGSKNKSKADDKVNG